MKKLLMILTICLAFGCKKKTQITENELTKNNWPLTSATISPAMNVNGKLETNYKLISGCLDYDYILSFAANGSFKISANAPMCDFFSFQNASYTQNGNELKVNNGLGHITTYILNGNIITNKQVIEYNNATYTVSYVFTAKSK